MSAELKAVETQLFGKLMQGEMFGHEVRVRTDEHGAPWFVAKDVCDIVGIVNYRDAMSRLDEDEKGISIYPTPGGPQKLNEVSESGFYHLIFKSRKPEAAAFRKMITKQGLPDIRRNGVFRINKTGE